MKTDESSVTLTIPTETYWISKYPITNGQFAKFIEAGGYKNQQWWTPAGWAQREKDKWTEPRYWTYSQWNRAEQPVVGVSWYESVAFCLWLSDVTGEKIMLPTEEQWQYAAQGTDGREYPWGKQWDASRCNNNVDSKGIGKTSPVRQYEGKGDSPFGVVDMAGNVWEWCLTDYSNKTNNINNDATSRVIRGGSWYFDDSDWFRCDYRLDWNPLDGNLVSGFRLSRFK
jgi:formylglycine-generating enzyme required for sulfatase activity